MIMCELMSMEEVRTSKFRLASVEHLVLFGSKNKHVCFVAYFSERMLRCYFCGLYVLSASPVLRESAATSSSLSVAPFTLRMMSPVRIALPG